MHTVELINFAIMCLFFACYTYQFLYIPISWFAAKKPAPPAGAHRFAVLIAARNEQEVIGNLIDSIKAQDYPEKLIKIFVVADNCTDATARVARQTPRVTTRLSEPALSGWKSSCTTSRIVSTMIATPSAVGSQTRTIPPARSAGQPAGSSRKSRVRTSFGFSGRYHGMSMMCEAVT